MPLSAALQSAFEAFWKAYPARPDNPKAPAREVFARRCREGADPAAIVRAAAAYAAQCRAAGKDCKFIPHSRTWLSQRRYEDFAAPAEPVGDTPNAAPPHPLSALAEAIGEAAWRSWIEPLTVEPDAQPRPIVRARHRLQLDRVRSTYGALIAAHLGPFDWALVRKEKP